LRPEPGVPYRRARPSTAGSSSENSNIGQWRSAIPELPQHPTLEAGSPSIPPPTSVFRYPPMAYPPMAVQEEDPNTFKLFTTTGFAILRASSTCTLHTGFPPTEFIGRHLLDFIPSQDRHLLQAKHSHLLSLASFPQSLVTSKETELAIPRILSRDAESVAEGMGNVYPNVTIRVLHSDRSWGRYNVRIHFGGGCGGSLRRPETSDRAYLVVSFLHIPEGGRDRLPGPQAIAAAAGSVASLPSFATLTGAADRQSMQGYYAQPARSLHSSSGSTLAPPTTYGYPAHQSRPNSSHATYSDATSSSNHRTRPATATSSNSVQDPEAADTNRDGSAQREARHIDEVSNREGGDREVESRGRRAWEL
jgi:hypothetical protein